MTDNMKSFIAKVSADKELRDEIIKLNLDYPDKDANIEKLIQLASKHNLTLAADDFVNDNEADEINEENLDNIAGGGVYVGDDGKLYGDCKCSLGGIGNANEYQEECLCAYAGQGFTNDAGKTLAAEHGCYDFRPLECVWLGKSWE